MHELTRAAFATARSLTRRHKLFCAFCGRDEDKVARLVGGGSVHICDSCIAECAAVLDRQDRLEAQSGFDRPGPTQSQSDNTFSPAGR